MICDPSSFSVHSEIKDQLNNLSLLQIGLGELFNRVCRVTIGGGGIVELIIFVIFQVVLLSLTLALPYSGPYKLGVLSMFKFWLGLVVGFSLGLVFVLALLLGLGVGIWLELWLTLAGPPVRSLHGGSAPHGIYW